MYAIQTFFEGSWLYVLDCTNSFDPSWPNVLTFETLEEADRASEAWKLPGKEEYVKVVPFDISVDILA